MSDNGPASVGTVRGEMQPWTDYAAGEPPATGLVLLRLLDDVLPAAGRVLLLGPHERAIVDAVLARGEKVTLLLRSVSDAEAFAGASPALTVLTGALDGLAGGGPGQFDHKQFDAVIALDGLDRLLGADSDDLDWAGRLDLVARLAAGAGHVIIACENEASLVNLLDRRPAGKRHGDDEWRPIYDDPARPVSPEQFRAALAGAGLAPDRLYAAFGPAADPRALLDVEVAAAATTPGTPPVSAALTGLEAAAAATPLLASAATAAEGPIRGGLLGAVAPGWLAVRGGRGADWYAQIPGEATVGAERHTADGRPVWRLTPSTADQPATGATGGVTAATANIPATVPDTGSVEWQLLRIAAAEDVPAFRALAARIGHWYAIQYAVAPDRVPCLDDLHPDGDGFAWGVHALVTVLPERETDLLAAAWTRFRDRLIRSHRRHPWPPWAVGADLVSAWVAMSGHAATPESLERARGLADWVATTRGEAAPPAGDPAAALREALVAADAARKELFELKGHVFGLERTIGYRDRQLSSRDKVIRDLHGELGRIRGYRAYKLYRYARKAFRIARRDPHRAIAAAKRKLR